MREWTYRKTNTNSPQGPDYHVYAAPMDASPIHAYTKTEEQAAKLVDALLDAEKWVSLMGYYEAQQKEFLKRFGVPEIPWHGSK
jgi:hypothetical protein